ncbi:solute carrier family 2, facilitated glucose transporter member 11-like isoform X4 [Elgaria multicarinata webbii]|uniref:solute carrier family 2, facilitated glucose transporter member 11-like isoform X4 n=1 Tax=Elgaria multicarinata webbii TaxID=159646 RepID=UPI002FCD65D4
MAAAFLWDLIQYQRLLLMMLVLGIGGSLQLGFQGSMIPFTSLHVKTFINDTWLERSGHPVHPETLTLLWSLIVSIFGLGGLLGSMASGHLTAKYGKKRCLLGNNVLMLASAFLVGFSKVAKSFELILAGRFLCGISTAMKTLWGEGSHQAELEDLRKEQAAIQSSRSKSVLELLKEPSLRWQLYVLVLLVVSGQLSGIQAIYFYMFEVLHTAGLDNNEIPYLSLGVSLSELFSALLCSFLIERAGRRVLLWGGYGLMATVLAAITLTFSLQPWFSWMPYCSLTLIFCLVIFFGMGPAGATASVRMEIFDQSSRSSAFVISSVLNWVGVFVIGMAFPFIVESLRQFSFLVFMGVLYMAGFLTYFFLPETKEKSILEIREEFDKLNFKKKPLVLETSHIEGRTFCTKL